VWNWQRKSGQEPPDHKSTTVTKTWREALDPPGNKEMKDMADPGARREG
jgi:hypothetical protein